MLYYNDENLMFASLASNRRQTVFRLRMTRRPHIPLKKRPRDTVVPLYAILRAGLHHAAHAGIHGRCGLGLRDVDDGTLGGEEHAGH